MMGPVDVTNMPCLVVHVWLYGCGQATARCSFSKAALAGLATASAQHAVAAASIQSTTYDPQLSNNQASLSATVSSASADLAVAISAPGSVNASAALAETIDVSNLGPSDTDGVQVTVPQAALALGDG